MSGSTASCPLVTLYPLVEGTIPCPAPPPVLLPLRRGDVSQGEDEFRYDGLLAAPGRLLLNRGRGRCETTEDRRSMDMSSGLESEEGSDWARATSAREQKNSGRERVEVSWDVKLMI